MYSIDISALASEDVDKIMDWYCAIAQITANRFRSKLYRQFDVISEYPEIKASLYKNVHAAKLDGFPYSVHYTINKRQKQIHIIGVFHTAANPENWKR